MLHLESKFLDNTHNEGIDEEDDDEEGDHKGEVDEEVNAPVVQIIIVEDNIVHEGPPFFKQLTGTKTLLKEVVFNNTSSKRGAVCSSSTSSSSASASFNMQRKTRSTSSFY